MDGITSFIEIALMVIGGLVVATALLFVIANYCTRGRAKEFARALMYRFGATAAVFLVGLPLQPIPEVDGIYDIGALIALAVYWYGLKGKLNTAANAPEKRAHIAAALPRLWQLLRSAKRK